MEHLGEWRPVEDPYSLWTLKDAGVACRELDCGSAVSVEREESSKRPVWGIDSDCVQPGSALRECAASYSFSYSLNLTCSGKPIRDIVYDIMSSVSLLVSLSL